MRTRPVTLSVLVLMSACFLFENPQPLWAGKSIDQEWEALARTVMANYQTVRKASPVRTANHSSRPVTPTTSISSTKVSESAMARTLRHYNSKVTASQAADYARFIGEAGRKYNVDPALMTAVIIRESRGNYKALSRSGAVGLTQVLWKVHHKNIRATFPHIKSRQDLFKPQNNITVGTWILSGYLKSSGGNVRKALVRYLGRNNASYVNQVLEYRRQVFKYQ